MIKKKDKNLLILFGIFVLLIIFALSIAKYSDFKEKNVKNKNINLIFNTNVAKTLLPGEKSNYSVTFYIDDRILKNSKVKDINDVNILYTFLKVSDF